MVQLGTQAERTAARRRAALQSQGRLHHACLFAMGPFLSAPQPGFCPPINQDFLPELLSPPSAPSHPVTTPAGASFKIPWEADTPARTPSSRSPAERTSSVAWLLRPSDTTLLHQGTGGYGEQAWAQNKPGHPNAAGTGLAQLVFSVQKGYVWSVGTPLPGPGTGDHRPRRSVLRTIQMFSPKKLQPT